MLVTRRLLVRWKGLPYVVTGLSSIYFWNQPKLAFLFGVVLFLTVRFMLRRVPGEPLEPSDRAPGRVVLVALVALVSLGALLTVANGVVAYTPSSALPIEGLSAPQFEDFSAVSLSPGDQVRFWLLFAVVVTLGGSLVGSILLLPALFGMLVTALYDLYMLERDEATLLGLG